MFSSFFPAIADNLLCVTSTLDTMDDICQWRGINETTHEKLHIMIGEEIEDPHCV